MEIFQNHLLAPYTTVKIGGLADTFVTTDTTEEFIEALKKFHPIAILGNGSNTLISDSGFRGTVIKNLSNSIQYLPNNQVKVDSGVQIPLLITDTINHYLSDLEEFAYIPSTLGGAIYGNIHGDNKNNFNQLLVEIEYFDLESGKRVILSSQDIAWDYDFSEFQQHPQWFILSALIQLSPGDSVSSKKIVTDIVTKKTKIQSMNSLGSVFRNPPNDSAGRIIDQELHLKGYRINHVQVSPLHANFILNLGQATASDYFALIKKIQSEAKLKGYTLEPEIKFLGDFN